MRINDESNEFCLIFRLWFGLKNQCAADFSCSEVKALWIIAPTTLQHAEPFA